MASEIKVDTVSEKTAANGVTIDGVNIKDSALVTAGSVPLSTIDIDGGTDIGEAIVDADLLIIDNGADGTNRKTVASRLKTYITPGITMADQWNLTTAFTGAAEPIASNWERNDFTSGYIGSAMTESSGIFTFPSTGMYYVTFTALFRDASGESEAGAHAIIQVTTNNSSYANKAAVHASSAIISGSVADMNAQSDLLLDVSNTTNVKVRFRIYLGNANTSTLGSDDINHTYATFIRLGDT